jgi:hypothetical protein
VATATCAQVSIWSGERITAVPTIARSLRVANLHGIVARILLSEGGVQLAVAWFDDV